MQPCKGGDDTCARGSRGMLPRECFEKKCNLAHSERSEIIIILLLILAITLTPSYFYCEFAFRAHFQYVVRTYDLK